MFSQSIQDAARAAKQLPGTSLEPNAPVALWGYSLVSCARHSFYIIVIVVDRLSALRIMLLRGMIRLWRNVDGRRRSSC